MKGFIILSVILSFSVGIYTIIKYREWSVCKPQTKSGKWSVWLNTFFLIAIIISVILVNVLGLLSYNDHWWDVTVPIVFLASIAAFILGIIAIIKNKEHSAIVYISIIIGLLTILFIPLHSLFIND